MSLFFPGNTSNKLFQGNDNLHGIYETSRTGKPAISIFCRAQHFNVPGSGWMPLFNTYTGNNYCIVFGWNENSGEQYLGVGGRTHGGDTFRSLIDDKPYIRGDVYSAGAVFDYANKELLLYFNGELIGQVAADWDNTSSAWGVPNGSTRATIGQQAWPDSGRCIRGFIEDFALWDVRLEAGDFAAMHLGESPNNYGQHGQVLYAPLTDRNTGLWNEWQSKDIKSRQFISDLSTGSALNMPDVLSGPILRPPRRESMAMYSFVAEAGGGGLFMEQPNLNGTSIGGPFFANPIG